MKSLYLIVLAILVGASASFAQAENPPPIGGPAYRLGVGIYSGYDIPVLQQDAGSGSMYGLSVRGHIWHFVHGELFFRSTSQGDKRIDTFPGDPGISLGGGTLTGFGFNVLLAHRLPVNIWPYGLLGVSTNSRKPDRSFQKDETLTGWTFGGGTGINLYHKALYFDINTALTNMPFHNNKASRKDWQSKFGIQYFIPIGQK